MPLLRVCESKQEELTLTSSAANSIFHDSAGRTAMEWACCNEGTNWSQISEAECWRHWLPRQTCRNWLGIQVRGILLERKPGTQKYTRSLTHTHTHTRLYTNLKVYVCVCARVACRCPPPSPMVSPRMIFHPISSSGLSLLSQKCQQSQG